jgi:Mg-chelatase subunit ChlD
VTPDKIARPARLPLGATTGVTLTLDASCGPAHARLDVVLVIDRSCGLMSGERLRFLHLSGPAFVDAMVQADDRIAIVATKDETNAARLVVPPTNDKARLKATLAGWRAMCLQGDGSIEDGLRVGRETLTGFMGRPDASKALVLMAQGAKGDHIDRSLVMWEAQRLWSAGVRVYTIGGEPDSYGGGGLADNGLLGAVASRADGYLHADKPEALLGIYTDLGRDLANRDLFHTLVITDRIPANMRLVRDSVQPPAEILPDGGQPDGLLRWRFDTVGLAGLSPLTYRLEPLSVGHWPTNIEAAADYTDGLGFPGQSIFPVPEVDVLAPTPVATPTDEATPTEPPTATATASSTPTPSPTDTASPTLTDMPPPTTTQSPTITPSPTRRPTRTPTPRPIYLPITLRTNCIPRAVPLDVALVIDTSSSMTGAKLDAARSAARTFVEILNLPTDHATIIGFDGTGRVAQSLTGDRTRLITALDSLRTSAGTRIDRGLTTALGELGGPLGRRGADKVVVLLTDGRPADDSEPAILDAARQLRDLRAAIYAVGLGDDVQPDLLTRITSDPRRVYLAPTERELAAIYGNVARLVPCR